MSSVRSRLPPPFFFGDVVNTAIFAVLFELISSITAYEPPPVSQYPSLVSSTHYNITRTCTLNVQDKFEDCYRFISSSQIVYVYQQNVIMYDPTIDFSDHRQRQKLIHEAVHVLQHHKYKYSSLDANAWYQFEREADNVARHLVNSLQEINKYSTVWDGIDSEHIGSESRGWK